MVENTLQKVSRSTKALRAARCSLLQFVHNTQETKKKEQRATTNICRER